MSTSNFTLIQLAGNRTVVKGTDGFGSVGETILDSSQWDELTAQAEHAEAHEDFDAAVNEFFAPLMDAQEKLAHAGSQILDPSSYVVLEEPVEGVAPRAGKILSLTKDTQILRLIHGGDQDRLVWVGDSLEILAFDAEAEARAEAEAVASFLDDVAQAAASDEAQGPGNPAVSEAIPETGETTAWSSDDSDR